jgi:hypothetical protein
MPSLTYKILSRLSLDLDPVYSTKNTSELYEDLEPSDRFYNKLSKSNGGLGSIFADEKKRPSLITSAFYFTDVDSVKGAAILDITALDALSNAFKPGFAATAGINKSPEKYGRTLALICQYIINDANHHELLTKRLEDLQTLYTPSSTFVTERPFDINSDVQTSLHTRGGALSQDEDAAQILKCLTMIKSNLILKAGKHADPSLVFTTDVSVQPVISHSDNQDPTEPTSALSSNHSAVVTAIHLVSDEHPDEEEEKEEEKEQASHKPKLSINPNDTDEPAGGHIVNVQKVEDLKSPTSTEASVSTPKAATPVASSTAAIAHIFASRPLTPTTAAAQAKEDKSAEVAAPAIVPTTVAATNPPLTPTTAAAQPSARPAPIKVKKETIDVSDDSKEQNSAAAPTVVKPEPAVKKEVFPAPAVVNFASNDVALASVLKKLEARELGTRAYRNFNQRLTEKLTYFNDTIIPSLTLAEAKALSAYMHDVQEGVKENKYFEDERSDLFAACAGREANTPEWQLERRSVKQNIVNHTAAKSKQAPLTPVEHNEVYSLLRQHTGPWWKQFGEADTARSYREAEKLELEKGGMTVRLGK